MTIKGRPDLIFHTLIHPFIQSTNVYQAIYYIQSTLLVGHTEGNICIPNMYWRSTTYVVCTVLGMRLGIQFNLILIIAQSGLIKLNHAQSDRYYYFPCFTGNRELMPTEVKDYTTGSVAEPRSKSRQSALWRVGSGAGRKDVINEGPRTVSSLACYRNLSES